MKTLIMAAIIAVSAIFVTAPAMALNSDCPNRIVTIHNQSSYTLESFQLKGVDSSSWSGNYLSQFDVFPGESFTVDGDFAPGADSGYHVFDYYVTSYEGATWSGSFDMCVVSDLTLWD